MRQEKIAMRHVEKPCTLKLKVYLVCVSVCV